MAAPRFLNIISGKIQQVIAAVTTAANSIVATDSTGRIDISMMPVGVAAEVVVCPSFENLATGQFVNLYSNAGALNARLSNATDASKPIVGFVLANVTAPANATVFLIGSTNTGQSGLTVGVDYYADTTPGAINATPPSASGNIVQRIGTSQTSTAITLDKLDYIILT